MTSKYSVLTPVEEHHFGRRFQGGTAYVKREDQAKGADSMFNMPTGAKVRQFENMIDGQGEKAMAVGCSANSAMQIYVAAAARVLAVPCVIVVPFRNEETSATRWSERMGAEIRTVKPGYPSQYRKAAREAAAELGGVIRWDLDLALEDTAYQVANIPEEVKRVVVASGSGLTAAGVLAGLARQGMMETYVLAVSVSQMATVEKVLKLARRITDLPLPTLGVLQVAGNYNTPVAATLSNGDPLDPFYAAKAEPYVHGGDCFWIPGVRPVESMPAVVQAALSKG